MWREQCYSLLISIIIALLYPGSLYIWPNASSADRSHPATIKRNFISVFAASIIAGTLAAHFIDSISAETNEFASHQSIFQRINFVSYRTDSEFVIRCIVIPVTHAFILFIGPIFADLQSFYLANRHQINGRRSQIEIETKTAWRSTISKIITENVSPLARSLLDIGTIRNLAVAPLTEEFLFRGTLIACLRARRCWSNLAAAAISSVLFALMHTHHFVARSLRRTGFSRIDRAEATKAAFQATYTAVFGFYAAAAYLATGHLVTPIVLHVFCNLNGLPSFGEIAQCALHRRLTIAGFVIWLSTLAPLSIAAFA